jgi:SNF2 family DNA or RNA helicase
LGAIAPSSAPFYFITYHHVTLYDITSIFITSHIHHVQDFEAKYATPILRGEADRATPEEQAQGSVQLAQVQKIFSEWVLHRLKKDIPEVRARLPQKHEWVVLCPLSSLQSQLYEHLVSLPDIRNARRGRHGLCPCGGRLKALECPCRQGLVPLDANGGIARRAVLYRHHHFDETDLAAPGDWTASDTSEGASLEELDQHLLRKCKNPMGEGTRCPGCIAFESMNAASKIASIPALLQITARDRDDPLLRARKERFLREAIPASLLERLGGTRCDVGDEEAATSLARLRRSSGKLAVLERLLQRFGKEDHKTLVFSPYTSTLDIIERFLKPLGFRLFRLDGKVPIKQREQLLQQFRDAEGAPVFLASTKAGGTGLNLQVASRVVTFDCDWNPSTDAQVARSPSSSFSSSSFSFTHKLLP